MRALVADPDRLEMLECYLSRHFDKWLERFAGTPDGIVDELDSFAGTVELPF